MGKPMLNIKNEIRCENCKAPIRIKSLVKLKDRYCCPYCFSTIKAGKEK